MTREEAIKIINCYDIGFCDLSGEKITADKLAEAFDMAIEALQTEIVRCEDCKYKGKVGDLLVCRIHEVSTRADDYCSRGERNKYCEHAKNPSGDIWECDCFLDTYCEHQIYDRNPDGTLNIVKCGERSEE